MRHVFDNIGICVNPTMEFSQQGKYLTVQITSADTPNGVVFGYNFRGVRAYECVACGRNSSAVPTQGKKRELKRIIDSAVAFLYA